MSQFQRNAFLYLEPTPFSYGSPAKFAQCETCMMWTGQKRSSCTIHSPMLHVPGHATCGFYVNGQQMPEMAGQEEALVTPQESGFEIRQVRCENCQFFHAPASTCQLFVAINKAMPTKALLNPSVHKWGCCNANTSK